MAVLDSEIQEQIDKLRGLAYEKLQENKIEESFEIREQSWNLYPDPKENWNEAYNTAKYAFIASKKLNDFDRAKSWLNRMIAVNNNLHLSDTELCFYIAIYKFDTGDYEDALSRFKEVVKIAKFRYFQSQDKIYLDFYKNPDKYMKS